MAYTNATFYLDLTSGSDTARTALTSCTASNPSGTTTRINKTGHGLVTGAIVDLTLFSTWLNDAWKITVVDADNFDLDDAVWQTTGDNSGTVTPRGGSSWSDAWLTVSSGATSSRTQPGDTIRVAKTPDPVSLGQNATFTNNSQTVTLTTAVTKTIHDATGSSGWTAAANITLANSSSRKLGSDSLNITPAAGFTTGKMCYAAIAGGGTQDFSGYEKICLWFSPANTNSFAASGISVCLCSDTTGDTVVNTLNLPTYNSSATWQAITIDYGGALSSSIQSVAIYANVDPGTKVIRINNIFATNDLTLNHVIGKSGDVNYMIQSIDGTTIKIDSASSAASGRGYSGTSETVTLYYESGLLLTTGGGWETTQEAGNISAGNIVYSGGWDTGTNTRNGYTTLICQQIQLKNIFANFRAHLTLSYFKFFGFTAINSASGTNVFVIWDNCIFSCGSTGPYGAGDSVLYTECKFLNCTNALALGDSGMIIDCEFRNNNSGLTHKGGFLVVNCVFVNNATDITADATSGTMRSVPFNSYLRNCLLSSSSEFGSLSSSIGSIMWSFDHDQTVGNHYGFSYGATIFWQTTTKQGSDPGAWEIEIDASTRSIYPVRMPVAEIAVSANNLVTVKAWVKKEHATNIEAYLLVEGSDFTLAGITETTTAKADDTNWEELTLTFTPTRAGVVPVFLECYGVSGTNSVYLGSVTITQA